MVWSLGFGVAAQPQAPRQPPPVQQPPTFRTGAELVRVDVTVLDRSGTPVTHLTAGDFVVFEDGVPQKIQSFQRVEFNGEHGPDEDLTLTIGPRDNRNDQLAREDVRLFLVFWDEYHIRPVVQEKFLRDELLKFVRTMLQPTDLLAIMDPWTPMSDLWFSRDRYRLATQAGALRGRQGVLIPRNVAEENHFRTGQTVPFVREQVALTALKSAIAHLGTLREGRKTLLYVGQEFGLGRDTPTWAMDVIRAANAENVSIYSINPQGLEVNRSNFRSGLLASIAHETGGESFVSNSPAVAFRRAVRQAGASYLLGYAPSPLRQDGRFHEIEVKVKGDGLQVRARRGYFAPDAAQKVAARTAAAEAVLPGPIEAAFSELTRLGRPESAEGPREVRTILVPQSPSPALALRPPVLRLIQTPAELRAAQSGTSPPPHAGREFARTDRLLVSAAIEGELASRAEVSVRLVDRRGKPLTDLPFTRTPDGSSVDLPLQSIARGDYLIAIEAVHGDTRSAAYVPIRVR
ncbi:MAG TPA: VWA domain-containing protein [Vicinamibacterales bacterium]|nr:VWA domain-containing protein [Vicinamibacterales bacterium]